MKIIRKIIDLILTLVIILSFMAICQNAIAQEGMIPPPPPIGSEKDMECFPDEPSYLYAETYPTTEQKILCENPKCCKETPHYQKVIFYPSGGRDTIYLECIVWFGSYNISITDSSRIHSGKNN